MVLAVVVALVGAITCSRPAAAKDEVHFDPDSPAGTEYALPLDRAREEATGGVTDGEPGEPAPLFGVGVSGADGISGEAGKGEQISPAGQDQEREQQVPKGTGSQGNEVPSLGRSASLSPADGGYSLARGVGMVAAIVLLGGALGLALRKAGRLRRT